MGAIVCAGVAGIAEPPILIGAVIRTAGIACVCTGVGVL